MKAGRTHKTFFTAFWLCILMTGCTEEPKFTAPLVQTGGVMVTENGVHLTGFVSQTGAPDSRAGFVWGLTPGPVVGSSPFFETSPVVNGVLETDVFYDLLDDEQYFVRAYGISGGTVIYGEELTFVSLGSNPPEITSVNPAQAPRGSVIEVTGKFFSSLTSHVVVRLEGASIDVLEASPTRLLVKIPELHRYSGPQSLSVTIAERTATAPVPVVVEGPIITSLDPPYVKAGDTLSILGEGFVPNIALTQVLFGTFPIPVISVSDTEITALIPYDFTSGNSKIAVDAEGVLTYSSNPLEVRNPWSAMAIPGGQPYGRTLTVAVTTGTDFYYGLGGIGGSEFRHQLWKNTPGTVQWTQLPNYPSPEATRACFGFALGTKIFVGLGDNGVGCCLTFDQVWQLETTTSTWTQKSNFPGGRVSPVNFVINGTAYVGLGADGTVRKDFYRYNPGSDTWTQLSDFPGPGGGTYTSFTTNGRGYFVQGTQLWEYNPGNDFWTLKGPMPSNLSNASAVVAGTKVYFFKKALWEYYPANDFWVRRANVPVESGLSLSSGYYANGILYIYGGSYTVDGNTFFLNEFLKYNPQP